MHTKTDLFPGMITLTGHREDAKVLYNDDSSLELVASMLLENKVGVIPADTIYGFSARANEITAGRIYEIKERPRNKSFIMLCGKDWLRQSRFIVPEELYDLWPCPLSVIVADREGHTQAVRVPQDKYILSLVRLTGPLWSTSCNISSMPSLTSYDEITAAFAGKADFFVRKRKESTNALPSTLIDCTSRPFRIIRQGAFDCSCLI